jgi:hypothetical protein
MLNMCSCLYLERKSSFFYLTNHARYLVLVYIWCLYHDTPARLACWTATWIVPFSSSTPPTQCTHCTCKTSARSDGSERRNIWKSCVISRASIVVHSKSPLLLADIPRVLYKLAVAWIVHARLLTARCIPYLGTRCSSSASLSFMSSSVAHVLSRMFLVSFLPDSHLSIRTYSHHSHTPRNSVYRKAGLVWHYPIEW